MTDFRNIYDYMVINNSLQEQPAVATRARDDMLKNNLQDKELRIQKFYINNTKTAIFYPDPQRTEEYYNTQVTDTTVVKYNNTLDSQSIKYYLVVRNTLTNVANIVFFKLVSPNNNGVPAPETIIYDDYQYYMNPYYRFNDFTDFMSLVVSSLIQTGEFTLGSYPQMYLADNNTVSLYVDPNNLTAKQIEFSPSLYSLFPFKATLTDQGTYRLNFTYALNVTINTTNYLQLVCNLYDTVYPFTQMLFVSRDGNLNPINFYDRQMLASNLQTADYNYAILSYDIGTNEITSVYNFYKYVNEHDTLWCNFQTDRTSEKTFTIEVFLRLKNNVLIPYMLGPNEIFSFSLECRYKKNKR